MPGPLVGGVGEAAVVQVGAGTVSKSFLLVADPSFQNLNVSYELALRHVTGKPTVYPIRSEGRIPFDVHDFRTIQIDMECKYDLVHFHT